MLDLAILQAFNRLLTAAPWAREKLAPFAGKRARLVLGPLPLEFRIAPDGSLESLGTGEPAVEIILPATAPLALLQGQGREAMMREAHITGAADFAEALGFVLRNLDWDAEEDLSRVVGDIVAHRFVRTAGDFAAAQAEAARRLVENIEEYLRYEQPAGIDKAALAAFAGEVGSLKQETDDLERRLAALELRRPV
jgi:ubiquinone biosynthesis accessory factor UbiJ